MGVWGGGPAIWGGLWGSHPLQCDFFVFHLPLGAVHLGGGGERKVRGGQKKLGRGLGGGGVSPVSRPPQRFGVDDEGRQIGLGGAINGERQLMEEAINGESN